MKSSEQCNRDILRDLLNQHVGSRIQLQESGGTLRLQGKLKDIDELDICGFLLVEALIFLDIEGLQAHLTLHQDLLGIQISTREIVSETPFIIAREVLYERVTFLKLDETRRKDIPGT